MATACSHCHAPLPAPRLGGVCPACLMGEALESLDELTAVSSEDPSSLPPAPGSTPDPLEGTTVGPGGRYKLLQRIGEGGFGTVYMAEQISPVRRRVAVKILKAGMDTRQVVARFEAERQALALMDHPNIARVLDGGETDHGRPFFVMELVRGTPITTFCDREKLDTRARLRLFTHVCRAVQHAHQKGIVHRDLKPTNVLVTVQDGAEPLPKVIDFGVAKALESPLTDKTLFTRFEQMVGTPAYMSPEQAGADAAATDIDTRADIYALGVLLYELLTGTTPIEAPTLHRAAFDEVRRLLRDQDAPRPSARLASIHLDRRQTIAQNRAADSHTLTRQLQGDLDWIVMKAIEKDRRRRYDTANGLAMDVERFLSDDPIEARPPSATYRLQKLARRHKTALAAAAAMAVLLLAGIAASTWQAVRATRAETLATERLHEAEAVSNFITGMFETASPGDTDGGRTTTVAEALGIAERRLEEDAAIPPQRRALLQTVIGRVYYSLGHYKKALELQEQSLEELATHRSPQDPELLTAKAHLALSLSSSGHHDEALALREEVYRNRRQTLGSKHRETLIAMSRLAVSHSDSTNLEKAVALGQESVDLARNALGQDDPVTLIAMNNLAIIWYDAGRRREALDLRKQVLDRRVAAQGPKHPFTLKAMSGVADSLDDAGRWKEAQAILMESLNLRRQVLGSEHPETIGNMQALARSLEKSGQAAEALRLFEEAFSLSRTVHGLEHSATLGVMSELAILHHDQGRWEEALALREKVLDLRRKVNGPDHWNTLAAMQNLAGSYFSAGRREEALALNEDLLNKRRMVFGPEHPHTIEAMTNMAAVYTQFGRGEDAQRLFEEAVALCDKHLDPEHPDALRARTELAVFYQNSGRREEAFKMREDILALRRKVQGPEHPDTLNATSHLLDSYQTAGRYTEVFKIREELLPVMRKVLGPDHPITLEELFNRSVDLFIAGRRDESITLQVEVLELRRKVLGANHPSTLQSKEKLITACLLADDMVRLLETAGTLPLRPDSPSTLTELILPHSEWRWLHPADGVDPAATDRDFHDTFFASDFDDSGWSTATDSEGPSGGFGYGDEGFTGVDIGKPENGSTGRTAFFRHRFATDREVSQLELRCRRDDGIIVYIDGQEVIRNNVSDGPPSWRLPAQRTVSGVEESTVFRFPLKDFVLPAGDHVLAISLHNTGVPSSDLSIGSISLVEVNQGKAE